MTGPNCPLAPQRLDDLLDGYLPPAEAAAAEAHLAACDACASALRATRAMRGALRHMPTPRMRPGFADAALAAAARTHTPAPLAAPTTGRARGRRAWGRRWQRVEVWTGATLGAAAAAALMVVLWGVPQRDAAPDGPAGVRLALYESRDIGVAIDTETALAGATLTIFVDGGIDLVGFGERREIRWQTDLDAGTNMLSLPIIAHSLEDGRLTALVEHGAKSQRIEVKVRVENEGPGQ
jgi:hypothetical protein